MSRGAVTLVFDDGYRAVFDTVLPLLRRYRLRAVFAVPVDTATVARSERSAVTPLEMWKTACAAAGHELAAHGVSHRALTLLDAEELATELHSARRATGATTLVYPGGAYDTRVIDATRQLFRAARTVRRGFESLTPQHPCALRAFVATATNFRPWLWNLRVLWVWLTNRWLIEVFHNVRTETHTPETQARHTVPFSALDAHLRFIRRVPTRVVTIRDIIHD